MVLYTLHLCVRVVEKDFMNKVIQWKIKDLVREVLLKDLPRTLVDV